eukprot:4377945-Lingulodinium_polyedra.AAC.1
MVRTAGCWIRISRATQHAPMPIPAPRAGAHAPQYCTRCASPATRAPHARAAAMAAVCGRPNPASRA